MAPTLAALGIDRRVFRRLAARYSAKWLVDLCLTDSEGRLAVKHPARRSANAFASSVARRSAIHEGLRWGEPTICQAGNNVVLWAVPLLFNARLVGGIVARTNETWLLPEDGTGFPIDLRAACEDLRRMTEEANLTNAALLAERRVAYLREQKRAEAIHEMKSGVGAQSMIETYLREEPMLLSAIRRGDRRGARGIMNRVLLVLYSMAGDRLDLVKSFVMELVVTMCRTAVECGGAADELLGANYARLTELSRTDGEEDLTRWLVHMLESIMDSLERHRDEPSAVLAAALRMIEERYAEDISRDDVARAIHLSPSYFSRFIRKRTGRSFTDLLNQARVDRACELLRRTDRGIVQIALDVGFSDQSYFTKVFRRHLRQTPRQYRVSRRRIRS
jgi:AraC-like DNA-binding protein